MRKYAGGEPSDKLASQLRVRVLAATHVLHAYLSPMSDPVTRADTAGVGAIWEESQSRG